VNSRYSRNASLVIEPSTAVPAMTPSSESKASSVTLRPLTKTCFFLALFPFLDLPQLRRGVRSSFDVSSRNPSSSGEYWAILAINSARASSFHSSAIL
jgi:hypothetical protein